MMRLFLLALLVLLPSAAMAQFNMPGCAATGTAACENGDTMGAEDYEDIRLEVIDHGTRLGVLEACIATIGSLETCLAVTNILTASDINLSSELAGLVDDETGTGALVFAASPTLSGDPLAPTAAASDNDTSIATTGQVRLAINSAAGPGLSAASGLLSLSTSAANSIATGTAPSASDRSLVFDTNGDATTITNDVVSIRSGGDVWHLIPIDAYPASNGQFQAYDSALGKMVWTSPGAGFLADAGSNIAGPDGHGLIWGGDEDDTCEAGEFCVTEAGVVTASSYVSHPSANPVFRLTDSTTGGEFGVTMFDSAGPDAVASLQVDIAGTLTSMIVLDGVNERISFGAVNAVTTGSMSAAVPVATSTGGALAVNTMTIATAPADYDIPDSCDSATGAWVEVLVRDAEVVSITTSDTGDTLHFPGIATLVANDELDSPGTAVSVIKLVCLEADHWYAVSGTGWVDGGVAD